jgi:hypothetical protein
VVDQLIEAVAHEPVRDGLLEPSVLELQHETLAKVARSDAGRIKRLNCLEHPGNLVLRVDRHFVQVTIRCLRGLEDDVVDRLPDVVDGTGQVPVFVDVADELLSQQHLARVEVEQRDLVTEMIAQVTRIDRDRLVVLLFLVLFAPTSGVEAIEKDAFPIDLVAGRLLFLRCGRFLGLRALLLFLFLRLHHLEEWVVQQFLLEVLLQVEEWHVQQVHRLVQARIDLELLAELCALIEPGLHFLGCLPRGEPGT